MIGERLGSYQITARLGAGGMGEVWLGTHVLIGSSAAIKVLRPACSESKSIVQRFFDEARAATRIDHPSIVTVYDFGWHEGRAYLVMELLRGETLAQAIAQAGRLEAPRALRILRQCATAMAAAHAAGIVHRDLKPDNIYLVPDPLVGERVKILDFGIAKLVGDDHGTHARTQTGMIMGTPAYMSPEQCRGAGGVDHRTDVYALGCVLFHMLTGRPPFIGATPGDLIASHLTVAAPAVSAVAAEGSAAIDALTARCLAKDVDARIGTMAELGASVDTILATPTPPPTALERAVSERPATATVGGGGGATTMQGSAGESLAPMPRRRGGRIAVAAIAVVIAAIVTAVIATRPDGDPRAAAAAIDATSPPLDAASPPSDAGAAASDAAPATAAIDAGVAAPIRKTPPRRGSGSGTPSGSGSGSGSGTGSAYDPYADR